MSYKAAGRFLLPMAGARNLIMVLGAVAIALLLIVAVLHPFQPENGGGATPSYLQWGTFTKLSGSSFGNTTHIYYISWYGCPIGAADSWAFYVALSALGNISAYAAPHYSDPADNPPSLPGLIFSDSFSAGSVRVQAYYIYNEYLNVSTSGVPLNSGNTISVGMAELQSSLPPSIYSLEFSAMEKIPTDGMPGASSPAPSALHLTHVNTNIIITGPHGAWILNGPLYSPAYLAGKNSTALKSSVFSDSTITGAAASVTSILNGA